MWNAAKARAAAMRLQGGGLVGDALERAIRGIAAEHPDIVTVRVS